MFSSLSGRFLALTIIFVILAEIIILVLLVSRFREDYLHDRLERAQIASLALLSEGTLSDDLQTELLANAEVTNIAFLRNELRQIILSSGDLQPIAKTFDMRDPNPILLIRDAALQVFATEDEVVRVIGAPVRRAGILIELTLKTSPLRAAMIDHGGRILIVSAIISISTAILLFAAVRLLMVKPIRNLIHAMKLYSTSPEDSRRIIQPKAKVTELREAEDTLNQLQTELTRSLRQKERLAQLGEAVAKVSHDLRNILTSAQLFADRIETSKDPLVQRFVPKIENSIRRAVSLCESTLAFGRAEEPPPTLSVIPLKDIVIDVLDSEQLAETNSSISLIEDVPTRLVLRVDQEQLFRVLSNLVRNARQAIDSAAAPGSVKISAWDDRDAWWIEVSDSGPGLPARAREHLFSPFQGSAHQGGTGLGLAISQELIRGHGGTLSLRYSGPEGTAFLIELPKGDATI